MKDLIERQAAIEETWKEPSYTDPINVLTEVRDRIKKLPSVQPEPCEDTISRADAIRVASGYCHPANVAEELAKLPSVQPEVIRCKDCRYYKEVTSIHGDCESADMWSSLFGEVTEVEAIEVHKDHYCGYAERRTDE